MKTTTASVKNKDLTMKQRKALLDSFNGKFYSVEWVKKDGSFRACTAKHIQHNMFANGHASLSNGNTCAHKENLYTCVDVTNGKWVNVSLDNLVKVKCDGVEYIF